MNTVAGVDQTRSELEAAIRQSRAAFRKAELARRTIRAGEGETITELSAPEFFEMKNAGLVYEHYKGEFRYNSAAAQKQLPGLDAASAAAKDRVERLRGSLRAGLGSLPAGVATAADVPGFMSSAESSAAETMSSSYAREQQLLRDRERLERERANKAAVSGIEQQAASAAGVVLPQKPFGERPGTGRGSLQFRREAIIEHNKAIAEANRMAAAILELLQKLGMAADNQSKRIDRLESSQ